MSLLPYSKSRIAKFSLTNIIKMYENYKFICVLLQTNHLTMNSCIGTSSVTVLKSFIYRRDFDFSFNLKSIEKVQHKHWAVNSYLQYLSVLNILIYSVLGNYKLRCDQLDQGIGIFQCVILFCSLGYFLRFSHFLIRIFDYQSKNIF